MERELVQEACDKIIKNFENCIERERPYCEARCPFHMEVFNFLEKMERGAWRAALRVYRDAVGFPEIASRICTADCRESCPDAEPIELRLLERAALQFAEDTDPTAYNLPEKKERIAIVGGGLSGMAALLRLSTKRYHVELFEAEGRLGGTLWDVMEPGIFLTDFKKQLQNRTFEIHLGQEITSAEELFGFDAVYVATGAGGRDFGLLAAENDRGEKWCRRLARTAYFAGGELTGDDRINALASGLAIGSVIDNYLKTKKLYYPKNDFCCRLAEAEAEMQTYIPGGIAAGTSVKATGGKRRTKMTLPVIPELQRGLSQEEAQLEARRCRKCSCDLCLRHCDLLAYTKLSPSKLRDAVLATTLEGRSELKATPAKRLISMCNQCGLCKAACPVDIDFDGLFLLSRQKMHLQGKMPWPFHDFWLRDMAQANKDASLVRKPMLTCDYAFFPGCQLPASEPQLTEAVYADLLRIRPDTGILLGCCGVPAQWAGDRALFAESLRDLRHGWELLGKPKLLLACTNCREILAEHMPDMETESLYTFLLKNGRRGSGSGYDLFDPCRAWKEPGLKETVRQLMPGVGELPQQDRCCGFGGHGSIANPAYADYVARRRTAESHRPYLTYCINCRDIFRKSGKDADHVLEQLYGRTHSIASASGTAAAEPRTVPTVTQRQQNRILLKKRLLEKYWGQEIEMPETAEEKYGFSLTIPEALREKLDNARILEDEIWETVACCEQSGRTIYSQAAQSLSGYCEIGKVTCWVEYSKQADGTLLLLNAYSHRMHIDLEEVWNGIKQQNHV